MKRLVFDTTDAATILDSDSVGAYVRGSDGTLVDTVTIATVDRLAVDATMKDGAGNVLTSTGGALDIAATDLDIRDLVFATDKVDVSGSTLGANDGVDIGDVTINNAAGVGAVNIQDGGNSITVDATQLDIDDLNATDDAVASHLHDGTGTAITSTGGAIDVNIASGTITTSDAALADTAIVATANPLTAANTAEDVVIAPLAARKYLFIYNDGNRDVYVGGTGVSAANGFPVVPEAILELRAGPSIDIEWVSANTNQKIKTLELS